METFIKFQLCFCASKAGTELFLGDSLALTPASSYHTGLSFGAPSGDVRLTWLFVPYATCPHTALLFVFCCFSCCFWLVLPLSEGASWGEQKRSEVIVVSVDPSALKFQKMILSPKFLLVGIQQREKLSLHKNPFQCEV